MTISARAAERVRAVHGAAGEAWLRELPDAMRLASVRWRLADVTPLDGDGPSVVAFARDASGAPCVLKLAPPSPWLAHEAAALAHWAGHGAVRLQAADPVLGALLMERAVPGEVLAELCARDDRAATARACDVILRLRAARAPAPAELPSLASWVERLSASSETNGRPALASAQDRARELAVDLLHEDAEYVVLHGDLHQENVVSAAREPWLATDPKGVVGPREADAAALLRNPRRFVLGHLSPGGLIADRLAVLAERLGDDARRIAAWGYVLAVLAAHWALEDDEGEDEADRWMDCAALLARAAP